LTEYTNDYTSLKDSNENQRTSFLWFILDDNNKINNYYVCAIKNNEPFCIEHTWSYSTMKERINEYYAGSCVAEHDSYGDESDNYNCTGEPEANIFADGPYFEVTTVGLGKCYISDYDGDFYAKCMNWLYNKPH